ncbi:MAG: YitT family protein, partial [Oceanospirillum sp.]|nr:YitT family protein [Oceanospirillum sp.]
LLIGLGLTFLIRAQASLGGITILAVFLERRLGINAARTTLTTDMSILMFGFIFFDAMTVTYSIAAFVAVGSVMGRYRKPAVTSPEPVASGVNITLKQEVAKA